MTTTFENYIEFMTIYMYIYYAIILIKLNKYK